MLPPGTLQSLIRRYQAARAKMEALAAEVAASLALPGQGGQMAAPVVKQRRAPVHTPNGQRKLGRPPNTGGEAYRMDQVVAAIRRQGPATARDIVRRIPGISMASAYTVMSKGVKDHVLVRVDSKGTYAVADSHAALPAIMRQAVKKKGKKESKPAPVQLSLRAAPGGGVSQQQRVMELAAKKGGPITPADVVAAGVSTSRKLAQQNLTRAVELGRFTKVGPGQYALKTPAG